ncbi:hypothetical protein HZS_6096 [Henneguya salminicola]|nr:hypothetical protein HZS_6096 [Henneguya salminicola]
MKIKILFAKTIEGSLKKTTNSNNTNPNIFASDRTELITRMKFLFGMASRFNHKNGALYKVCDSQLDEYDVDCIKRDEFLSDRAIHFFINYFYSKFAQDLKKTIEILSPEVVQLVKMVDGTI